MTSLLSRSDRAPLYRELFNRALALAIFSLNATIASAQYIDQSAVEAVLEREQMPLEEIPDVYYDYYVFTHPDSNTVLARNALYKHIGEGNTRVGQDRSLLLEMINRVRMSELEIGDTLIIPDNPDNYELDFRAYSPFPRYYPGARDFDKIFLIDKSIQAWAAYEYGQLARWGVVNTGSAESPTPTGRYNFNWKEPYRVSSLSPRDEPWEMYWVFNIHEARGIHIHQYAFPTGGPTSHGCVRLIDSDAKWIYNWADPWTRSGKGTGIAQGGRIVKQGTTVLVINEDPAGKPQPFEFMKRYPILRKVELPADPYDVPPGTPQQEHFDRLRLQQASR